MSALAFYKRLRDAGVDEATAMLCAEQFDVEVKVAVDAILEPRRAKDRARKAGKVPQNSAESTETPESEESAEAPLSRPLSPQTPLSPTHSPPDSVSTRARGPSVAKPNGFARFWEAYPSKVAKVAAEKAYAKAIGRISGPDPPGVLLAGVERAKASREWREGYIPHPTTWLNQGRWEDEPAEIIPLHPRNTHERSDHSPAFIRKARNLAAAEAGFDRMVEARRAGRGDGGDVDPFG